VHHGCGAGQRAHDDGDRRLGLEAADQHVMVDDRLDVRVVDRGRQFGGVVGVDDHHVLARFDVGDDRGFLQSPSA
jgi:hypothetical protein